MEGRRSRSKSATPAAAKAISRTSSVRKCATSTAPFYSGGGNPTRIEW